MQVLTEVVAAIRVGAAQEVLVPVLLEPDELLRSTLLPLLTAIEQPQRMALVVNQVHLDVLLPLLRNVRAERLAAVLNGLSEEQRREMETP